MLSMGDRLLRFVGLVLLLGVVASEDLDQLLNLCLDGQHHKPQPTTNEDLHGGVSRRRIVVMCLPRMQQIRSVNACDPLRRHSPLIG